MFDRLINLLAVLAGAMLVALTALICVDVLVRNSRLFSIPWTLDVAKYMLYGITFLGAPWVLRDGGHITIDLFVERLGDAAQAQCRKIAKITGAIVCFILTYYACRVVYLSFSQKVMINEIFVFPEWWLFALAPPIFLILFLTFVRAILNNDQAPRGGNDTSGGF